MAGIRRGTTPLNTFEVDVDLTGAEVIYITYKQNGQTVIEKTKDDCTITATQIEVELTQEETLAFILGKTVEVQIRARYSSGNAIASNIIKVTAEEILKEGVI